MELLILPPNLLTLSTDFRFNNWGDKIEDVIKNEGREPDLRSDTLIVYNNVKLGNINCKAYYCFDYTRFSSGFISFKIEIKELNEYISAYYAIKASLTNSLGEGKAYDQWIKDRFRSNHLMYGYALKNGDFSLSTQWLFPSNNIFLKLNNEEPPLSLKLIAMAPKH